MTPLIKVVLLGASNVGKTALVRHKENKPFKLSYDPTIETITTLQAVVNMQRVSLRVLDCGGNELFDVMKKQWIREADCVVLVYSVICPRSFEFAAACAQDVAAIKKSDLVPCVLVCNKCDLTFMPGAVPVAQALRLCSDLNCVFIETSCATATNVECVFEEAARLGLGRASARPADISGAKHVYIAEKKTHKKKKGITSKDNRGRKDPQATRSLFTYKYFHPDHARLYSAMETSNVEAVESLLQTHDINAPVRQGGTLLHIACCSSTMDMVSFLLAKNANVHALDVDQWTPLHCACRRGDLSLITTLIKAGADAAALTDDKNSALHLLCSNPFPTKFIKTVSGTVDLLVKKGCSLAAINSTGETPLHIAASKSPTLTRLLLEMGASPGVVNSSGRTPLHLAIMGKNSQAVKALLDRGAVLLPAPEGSCEALAEGNTDVLHVLVAYSPAASFRPMAQPIRQLMTLDSSMDSSHDSFDLAKPPCARTLPPSAWKPVRPKEDVASNPVSPRKDAGSLAVSRALTSDSPSSAQLSPVVPRLDRTAVSRRSLTTVRVGNRATMMDHSASMDVGDNMARMKAKVHTARAITERIEASFARMTNDLAFATPSPLASPGSSASDTPSSPACAHAPLPLTEDAAVSILASLEDLKRTLDQMNQMTLAESV
eukprot:CAMPEP_0177667154 /NCGR_PEP_ID=MMETSP0447-20121125/21967_1 /TAXON_ID=0 /ORGANISM="Stygamoeba regulata, Strain BSH-02190019" /LENGTH=661 /DNA_ID=CAMNT_0019173357 /DNA_START=213 /DNA_END=2198 /DNA_ORIENTATION=-